MATISQRISLDGAEQVKKQLAEIGDAGEKSVTQIQTAADKSDVFSKLAESAAKLSDAIAPLSAAIAKLTEATGGAAESAQKFGEVVDATAEGLTKLADEGSKAAEAIKAIDDASQKANENVTKSAETADKSSTSHVGLALAAVKAGAAVVSVGQAATATAAAVEGAAAATTTAGASIIGATAAVGTFAIALGSVLAGAIGAVVAGLATVSAAVEKATNEYEQLNHTLLVLSQTTATSFESLQLGTAALEQIGIKTETARNAVVKLDETLKGLDPGEKLKASADAVLQAEKAMLEAQLAAAGLRDNWREAVIAGQRLAFVNQQLADGLTEQGRADKAVGDASKELATAQANQLEKIIPLIKQIEEGQKGITFDEATTAATKIDALNARLKQVKDTTGDARQEFLKIIANIASLKDAIAFGATVGFSADDVDRIRRFGGEASKIPDLFQRISESGALIGPAVSQSLDEMRTSTQNVENAWTRLMATFDTTVFTRIDAAISTTLNNIAAMVLNATAAVFEAVNTAFDQIGTLLAHSVEGWGLIFSSLGSMIESAFSGIWDSLTSGASAAINMVSGLIDRLIAKLNAAWETLKNIVGLGGSPATGGGGSGFAAGGLLGGSGSGTSDSNLAWVSRGEYITPARAVAQPGVLAFLEALRRSGGNLAAVLDGMGRFALGGLVRTPIAIPAFAGGGMNHVTIQFPGLPEITGLRASSGVVDELRHAAALAQVRSGGRKPSRYS
jgi:hypothetical protein